MLIDVDPPVMKRAMPIRASIVFSLVPGFGNILDRNVGRRDKIAF